MDGIKRPGYTLYKRPNVAVIGDHGYMRLMGF